MGKLCDDFHGESHRRGICRATRPREKEQPTRTSRSEASRQIVQQKCRTICLDASNSSAIFVAEPFSRVRRRNLIHSSIPLLEVQQSCSNFHWKSDRGGVVSRDDIQGEGTAHSRRAVRGVEVEQHRGRKLPHTRTKTISLR